MLYDSFMVEQGPQVGTILDGRFRVSRHVSDTALGSRFVARDQTTRKQVAVVVISPDRIALHGDRFRQSSELAMQLDSPGCVSVLAYGIHQGHGYRVTSWERGSLLSEKLGSDRLLLSSAVSWMADIAGALAAAHEIGLHHFGICPNTIRIHKRSEPPDHALLDDWGLSRLLEGPDPSCTTGPLHPSGSAWLSPETIQGKPPDSRSDLYSLGAVLFHCVTGRPPFTGPSMKVMAAHINHPVPPLSQHASGVPHWLDELAIELMAKDPEHRPQDAATVAERLREGAALLVDGAAHPERITANVAPSRLPRVQIRGTGSARTPSVVDRPDTVTAPRPMPPMWFFALLVIVGVGSFVISFLFCMNG